jgi:pimeloyl-ACP methyl ester carboxylesterase
LLLLHGMNAHAHWWSCIAPFLAAEHRVVALSWSGMGRSGWRECYSVEIHAQEALEAARQTGLFDSGQPIAIVAHSYGAAHGARLANVLQDQARMIIFLDRPIASPRTVPPAPPRRTERRVYPRLADALASFRLQPAQFSENLFIIDHIAREALVAVEEPGEGWMWRMDPNIRHKTLLRGMDMAADIAGMSCTAAFLYGQYSASFPPEAVEELRRQAPARAPVLMIPGAAHHLMLDQPIATVTAIASLLAAGRFEARR